MAKGSEWYDWLLRYIHAISQWVEKDSLIEEPKDSIADTQAHWSSELSVRRIHWTIGSFCQMHQRTLYEMAH